MKKTGTRDKLDRGEAKPRGVALDYQIIFDAASNAMAFTEADSGKIVDVNAAWLAVTGFARDAAIGKTAFELGLWPDSAIRTACIANLQEEGFLADFEINLVLKSVLTPHLVSARIVEMDDSKYALWEFRNIAGQKQTEEKVKTLLSRSEQSRRSLLSILQDVKLAEDALRESEAKYRTLFDKSADGILIADVETKKFEYANPALCQMLGYTEDELRTMGVPEIHPKAALPNVLEEFESQAREEKTLTTDIPCVRKDGSIILVDINAAKITFDGRPCNVGFFRDITERKRVEEALRESEEKFRSLFESSIDGLLLTDPTGQILAANPAACRMLGRSEAEICQGGRDKIVDKTDPRLAALLEQRARTGRAQGELTMIRRDGLRFEAEISSAVFSTPAGLRTGMVIRDITERKQAEEALRRSEALLKQSQRVARFGHYVLDVASGIFTTSETIDDIFGIDASYEKNITNWSNLVHPDDREAMRTYLLDHVLKGGNPFDKEYRIIRNNDGRVCWVHGLGQLRFDADGKVVEMFGTIHDITERKRAEEAVRESQALHRSLVDQMPAGIFRKDKEGRFVYVSPWFCEFRGLKAEVFLGKTPEEVDSELANKARGYKFVFPELGAEGVRHHELIMQAGRQIEVEESYPTADGRKVYLRVVKSPVFDADGKIIGTQGVQFDITELKRAEESLRRERTLLDRITTASPIGIITIDRAGRITFANPEAEKILGLTRDAITRRTLNSPEWHVADQKGAPLLEEALPFRRVMKTGQSVMDIQHAIEWPDGRRLLLSINGTPLLNDSGEVESVVFTIENITERRQAETEIARAAREWQTTFDATNDAIWILDPNHRVVRTNKTAEQYFKRPCEEMLGKHCWEIVHGTTEPIPDCPFIRAQKSRQREMTELQMGEGWFEIIVDPIFDAAGQYAGAVHIVSDITQRKRAEERIREQAALLDAANDAIYVRALDHTVTYWNDGAERLYGWKRAEALGRKAHELITYDLNAFNAAHAVLLAEGNWSGELKLAGKTGKEWIVFCRWTVLRNDQGQPTEVLAINTDITEQKQLEANFLRAQRMEGIGALAGGIAHDLNNILQPILMTAPLMRQAVRDSEGRAMLETVESCAQRGADIVKQLLTFARGTPGVRVPLPLRHLLRDMDKIIHETFPRNIQLVVDVPKNLWLVMGDATQIHQALMNLCVNARDAMPDGGTLTLEAKNLTLDETGASITPDAKPGNYVCVSVKDTGTGIPSEHLDRIFEPFFTTKEVGKGTGLGLATVLGIVRGHGGFVRVNSSVGRGSTFELYLPASPQAEAADKSDTEHLPPDMHGELILVVDDEPAVRGVVQHTLEKHGYRVVTAAEGNEALALFAKHRAEIKAVITDLMMPGMDGSSLIRALRQLEPRLPILSMTGLGEQASVKEIEGLGSPLVMKPFARGELLVLLYQLIAVAAEQDRTAK